MATLPPARCESCKEEFPSKNAAKRHAIAAGHTGPIGFFCRECDELFGTSVLYRDHVSATGHTRMPIGCPICHVRFPNGGELAQHVATVSSCGSCGICLRPSETLADHLWSSKVHPKCFPCKLGFDKMADLEQHNLSCTSLPSAESPVPKDVPRSNTESTVTTRVNTPFVVLDARPSPQPPGCTVARVDAGKAPSWHCRSCLQEPCIDPVATICGHLFCHGCLMRELDKQAGCPVCGTTFFVRLHGEK